MRHNSTIKPIHDKKTFHSSWLIAWGSIGILIGVILSLRYSYFVGVEWVVVSFCMAVIAFINRSYLAVILILLSGFFLGIWRGSRQLYAQSGYQKFVGREVKIKGRVKDDVSFDVDGDLRLRLVDVEVGDMVISGDLWLATTQNLDIKRSDSIMAIGQLSKGFGNIPAAMYRARIISVQRQDYSDVARDLRDSFAEGIRSSVREPEASLGSGFLLGQKSALPEKLDQELRLLGLTHIVVASGYNLSILVRFARRFFFRISRFTALSVSGLLVYGFANITGFSPSMTRASIITGLSLIVWFYGRKFHPLVLLSLSAAITLLINPTYAWGDIGWLLSFSAFIGVIVLSPLIHAYFWGDEKPSNFRQIFIETLSAQILTLPLIIYVFERYSPLALLANVLVLPLIPLAMLLTFFAGGAGLFAPFFMRHFLGWPAENLLGYMTAMVDWLAKLPIASNEISFSLSSLIVSYLLLFSAMVYLKRRTNYNFRNYNIIE